jgi:hypothetical protein
MKWQVEWFVLTDKNPQPVATIVSVNTEIANALNPYGEVKSGRLTLKGRIKLCIVYWDHNNVEQKIYYPKDDGLHGGKYNFIGDGPLSWTEQAGQKTVRRGRDGPYERKMHTVGAVFCVVSSSGWMGREYMGLVLGPSEKEGCFERVGVSSWLPSDWYDSGVDANIVVV